MRTFTIDSENSITVFATAEQAGEPQEGIERFHSEQQLASLAAKWPGNRLIEIWNSLPGVEAVKKFTDRETAVRRIWKAIQSLGAPGGQAAGTLRSRRAKPGKQATRKKEGHTGAANTKTSQVIALLQQSSGASLKEIVKVTGWQAHSVRGFISGQLGKKLGLRVKSFKRDGQRVYAIRG